MQLTHTDGKAFGMIFEVNYAELGDHIDNSIDSGMAAAVISHPGVGKTTFIKAVANKRNIAMGGKRIGDTFGRREMLGFLYEPVDFRGLMVPQQDGSTKVFPLDKWPFESLVQKGLIPEHGVFVLDDMLNAPRSVLDAFAEPLCEHTVNGERLAPGWTIIATGNHIGGGSSAKPMPNHVTNRLAILALKPDWESWASWAVGNIAPELLGYFELQKGADLFAYDPKLRAERPNEPYLTPRSCEHLSRRIEAWRANRGDKPPMHLYASVVGDYGAKLWATLDYIHELAPWEEVLADHKAARLPVSAGAKFAQISILLGGLQQNCPEGMSIPRPIAAAVGGYMNRLPNEVQAVAHNRAMRLRKEWSRTDECTKWFVKNQSEI